MNAAALFAAIAALFAKENYGVPFVERREQKHGKRGAGSGMLRRNGHPLFQRRRVCYSQPAGYYEQGIDRRHIHSYGPFQSPNILKVKGELKRPTFA